MKESDIYNYIDVKHITRGSILKKYSEHMKRTNTKFTLKGSSLEEIRDSKIKPSSKFSFLVKNLPDEADINVRKSIVAGRVFSGTAQFFRPK
jgi:hypothetical protein